MILGTAGHIDHGKTALVRALTGVDTDRLPEEKQRGITIDLGFAPLPLAGVGTVGVVDVPGHEGLVRNMVAGATGIDMALLVVAADEGVMPQTREHLAILTLLGIDRGVVALTKTDLVDEEWSELAADDVRAAVADTALATARVIPVSGRTGRGLDELRDALAQVARNVPARQAGDLFRMPIDRAFSLRGTGTVVTGTVWSGELRRGPAYVFPPGRTVRVRDLQSHGRPVEAVRGGTRAAVALADVTLDEIGRGAVLTTESSWRETSTLRALVSFLPDRGVRVGPRTRLRLHLGSATVGARVVLLAEGQARVHLDRPILCRGGDRFVLRGGPQLATLGGGQVLDPYSRLRDRALALNRPGPAGVLAALCAEAGPAGIVRATMPIRLGTPPRDVETLCRSEGLYATAERAYQAAVPAAAAERLLALVDRAHASDHLATGVSLEDARAAVDLPPDLWQAIVDQLAGELRLAVSGAILHRPGWTPRLNEQETRLAESMMHAFCSAPDAPMTLTTVAERFGPHALPVLHFLEREGRVVRLGDAMVAAGEVVSRMVDRLRGSMTPGRSYSPAELRDALGVSRKLLIPLLEYCDRSHVTERRASGRVLRSG